MSRNVASPSFSSPRLDMSHDAPPPGVWDSRPFVAVGVGIVLFIVAYSNAWRSSFHFDDSHVVETNPAIRSLSGVPRYFVDARTFSSLPTNQTYRPIVTLTLATDHAIARATTGNGLDPRAYHLTQLRCWRLSRRWSVPSHGSFTR